MKQRLVVILGALGLGVVMGCGGAVEQAPEPTASEAASLWDDPQEPALCKQDGECGSGEDWVTCPADCEPPPDTCGDGACLGAETHQSCPADCDAPGDGCGDGYCIGTETHQSCPLDCDG
ncbi:tenascin-X [Myxococcus sp. K38C18041901]|uniref:tenascin-X n=1 Tax=Myxococcus guangdongensis TaxID=2906760 RepID=UPI0020A71517|nr:tenascin-X [Myxococcus guangdongensis]MCP3058803.1 tenascin-X [Myxococcus guangdongensis]